MGEHGGAKVLLRPASRGTGVIAGGGVRAVVEAAGVKDILSKSLGSANSLNVILATLEGMRLLRSPEEVAEIRGRPVSEVRPPWSEAHD
jgi:small subunit ribosomal protein S5